MKNAMKVYPVTSGAPKGLPLYRCHKLVGALKIASVTLADVEDAQVELRFVDSTFAEQYFPPSMFSRYMPRPGDYLVEYEDGYLSVSPCVAFESGYSQELPGQHLDDPHPKQKHPEEDRNAGTRDRG